MTVIDSNHEGKDFILGLYFKHLSLLYGEYKCDAYKCCMLNIYTVHINAVSNVWHEMNCNGSMKNSNL